MNAVTAMASAEGMAETLVKGKASMNLKLKSNPVAPAWAEIPT